MIPEAVVAYAAGVQHVLGCDWGAVAGYLRAMGLGTHAPPELGELAELWARLHVAPDALESLARARGGRRKVAREKGGAKSPKTRSAAGGSSK